MGVGVACLLVIVGGIAGAALGADKLITIYGKSQEDLKLILKELRSKARIPDYK